MSDSIGKVLKEKRESLGLTIEQVAEETKIQRRYIIDMETENFDDMPGKVYEKGFLKTYINLLNIDVEYAMELYEIYRNKGNETLEENEETKEKEIKGKSKGITLLFGGILFIIVGIIGIKFFVLKPDEKVSENQVAIVIDEVKDIPEIEKKLEEINPEEVKEEKLEEISGNSEDEEEIVEEETFVESEEIEEEKLKVVEEKVEEEVASSAKKVVEEVKKELVLLVKGNSWVEVSKNGKRVYFNMAKNREIKVEGNETDKIYVKVGDGSQVELILNGENKGVLGRKKEVFKKTFSRE